jgi:hypothetical protein
LEGAADADLQAAERSANVGTRTKLASESSNDSSKIADIANMGASVDGDDDEGSESDIEDSSEGLKEGEFQTGFCCFCSLLSVHWQHSSIFFLWCMNCVF